MATRRIVNPSRRTSESGETPFLSTDSHSRSRSPSYLAIALILLGALCVMGYVYKNRGAFGNHRVVGRVEGDFSCTAEVERAIPILRKAYGESMHKVLHVGPDTCSIISTLRQDQDTEAWGVEPYDIEDADGTCKRLVHNGLVRVTDIKFPLPYRAKAFPLVIVSDALDYLSPKYLNRTLPDLARVSSHGLVIFSGHPHQHKAKAKLGHPTKAKMRSATWWIRFFLQMSLEENEVVVKKFEKEAQYMSYNPNCQIFHLHSYH